MLALLPHDAIRRPSPSSSTTSHTPHPPPAPRRTTSSSSASSSTGSSVGAVYSRPSATTTTSVVAQAGPSSLVLLPPPPPHPHPPPQSPIVEPPPPPIDLHTYPAQDLLRLIASLLSQIAAANDRLPSSPAAPSPHPHHPPHTHHHHTHTNHNHNHDHNHNHHDHHPPIWSTLTSASRAALSTPSAPLTFHARTVPTISLHAYLLRIHRYCPAPNDVFLALLVYFDRMSRLSFAVSSCPTCSSCPACSSSSSSLSSPTSLASPSSSRPHTSPFVIDSYNIHRLIIAGVTVASKFFSDVFYTNSRYAKVGGLPHPELNQLELHFLLLNDFRLRVEEDEMRRYAVQLVRFSQAQEPPMYPAVVVPRETLNGHPHDANANGGTPMDVGRPPRARTPTQDAVRVRRILDIDGDADTGTDTGTETEGETDAGTETDAGSTDDEPTVRPAASVASFERDSSWDDDDDDDDYERRKSDAEDEDEGGGRR